MQLDEQRGEFAVKAQFDHPYPTTKIIWIPDDVSLPLVPVPFILCHSFIIRKRFRYKSDKMLI